MIRLFSKWLQMKNWGHFRRIVSLGRINDLFKLIDCKLGVVRQAKRNLIFSKMSLGAVSWISDIKNSFPKLLFWLFLQIIFFLLILTTISNIVFNLTSGVQRVSLFTIIFSNFFLLWLSQVVTLFFIFLFRWYKWSLFFSCYFF